MLQENFVGYIRESILQNWDHPALSDYKGETFHYSEIAGFIEHFHQLFRESGLKAGDKVGLIGKNSARWGIIYLATVSYGAVIVPVLPDFKADDLHQIIDHSDSILLFIDENILEKLDQGKMTGLKGIFSLQSLALLKAFGPDTEKAAAQADLQGYPWGRSMLKEDFRLDNIPNQDLAVISYTSGTTGFTKGVMLPHNSLAANIRYAQKHMPLDPGDQIVSFLPLAHAFGCAFEFLFPFTLGCHITILTKTPSPQVIIKAFQEIRPALILSVPLVIEKIYKNQLLPVIRKPHMKVLLAIPGLNKILFKKIKDKLTTVFGGRFRELVIGGAPLNVEAERFFMKIGFPFTVGYGMTECGPLISYIKWTDFRKGSAGKKVDTLELKIDSPDPEHMSGEIMVRGENVMAGYYKNPQTTAEILEDGWLHTGDLGLLDSEGNVYIKGRIKSMILGPSGQNIYPEAIESKLNNQYAVSESLVLERDNKLVALIYPDPDVMERDGLTQEDLMKIFEHHRKAVNHKVPAYMNVSQVIIHPSEFIKTPKRSIKRFLYK